MFCISPSYFCFLFHRPVLLNNWLFEHCHEFISHSKEGNNKICHPKHFCLTKLNVWLKSLNFISVWFYITIQSGWWWDLLVCHTLIIQVISGIFLYFHVILFRFDLFLHIRSASLSFMILYFFFWRFFFIWILNWADFYLFSVLYFLFTNIFGLSNSSIFKLNFNIFQPLFHLVNIFKWVVYFLFWA